MKNTKPYNPHGCKAKDILRQNIERAKEERRTRPWRFADDQKLHGSLEVGQLVASAEPVNTRKEANW